MRPPANDEGGRAYASQQIEDRVATILDPRSSIFNRSVVEQLLLPFDDLVQPAAEIGEV